MKPYYLNLNFISIVLLFSIISFFTSCKKEVGCTDPLALNYDPNAEKNCCCAYEKAEERYAVSINMKQLVNGNPLEMNTTGKPYHNAIGQNFNISTLRYLISDITFNSSTGESFTIEDYHFVDVNDESTLTYNPSIKIPKGTYSSLSFTFGFNLQDNVSGKYPELNSKNWNWPMGNGGYHYMQLEGFFDSAGVSKAYHTHMGPATDKSVTPHITENNHFIVNLPNSTITVGNNFSFDLIMNIEQWYENPYEWDFNIYNTAIMGNYEAQRKLNINGPSVFTWN